MTTAARASGESRVGWLLPVGPGRVAMWQLAVLAALAALATGFEIGPVTLTVLVLTGLLVVATSVRVGGLWVPVGGRVRALCVAAQAIHTTGAAPRPRAGARLRVHSHEDRVGNRTGIATVAGDHIAVVRLAPGGPS